MTLRFTLPRTIPVEEVVKLQKVDTRIKHVYTNEYEHCFLLKVIYNEDVLSTGIAIGKLVAADILKLFE